MTLAGQPRRHRSAAVRVGPRFTAQTLAQYVQGCADVGIRRVDHAEEGGEAVDQPRAGPSQQGQGPASLTGRGQRLGVHLGGGLGERIQRRVDADQGELPLYQGQVGAPELA